jgi:hypothetical protein
MSCSYVLMTVALHLSMLTAPANVADAPSITHPHLTGCNDDDTDPDHARAVVLKLPNGTFQTAVLDQP